MEEEEVNSRVDSPRNILNILPKVEIRPMNGRVLGTKSPRIPPMIQKIIGEGANISGEKGGMARAFDVHPNTVTRFSKEHGEAKAELDKDIHNMAVERIVGMFASSVSEEALAKMDTKDATRSMKDLSKVAESFGGKKGPVFNGPTIIIYSPSQHTEDDYDTIDVEAREIR